MKTSFTESLALLLFGPVIAASHFMIVYLLAETACAAGWLRSEALGIATLSVVILAITIVFAAVTAVLTRIAQKRRGTSVGDLPSIGSLLGGLFTVAIVLVGIPPAFLEPC